MKSGVPFLTFRDHGVENDDELAHAGDKRDFRLFSFADQATIEGFEHGVVPGRGAHTSHIEEIADLAASALDMAFTTALAAVVIVRRGAQQ